MTHTSSPSHLPQSEKTWGPAQHALLFACIAQEVLSRFGEQPGGEALMQAVTRYAKQRGSRMAQRAQRDGYAADMFAFMVYGEWRADPNEVIRKMTLQDSSAEIQVIRCPWYAAWEEQGATAQGKFYCQAVDDALAQGFNPALSFEIRRTRPRDGVACEFVYRGVHLKGLNALRYWFAKRFRPGDSAVMPWEYHLAHLHAALVETMSEVFGEEGKNAVQAGVNQFSTRFSSGLDEILQKYQGTDFDRLPVD